MPAEDIETVIIGAGQAGLAMSHHLRRAGRPHLILERHSIAERWRSERWDALTFQFPNWAMWLPGFPYRTPDPDGFAPRDEVVRFIEAYAAHIDAPVRTGVAVNALRRAPGGDRFLIEAGAGNFTAANVVLATGPYQRPAIPEAIAGGLGDIFQIHSSRYRNPAQLPPGAVLVVGSGASGCQIAEDLQQHGRAVHLAVSAHRRVPRRYRGRDFIWWMTALGLDEITVDQRPVRPPPLILTGADGGHDIDFRRLAEGGMKLHGRLRAAGGAILTFADDLAVNLAGGDAVYTGFTQAADALIARNGLDLPPATSAPPARAYPDPSGLKLDLRRAGIGAIVWATGFRYDLEWVDLPIFADAEPREPAHRRGVTAVPGAYFLGLQWLHKTRSAFLSGVGADAAYIAGQIEARA